MTESYSPERRTALVLTGTGADGAYHAGVLRALHESGIKIDLVCGRGIGAVGAVLTAVDGAERLWDSKGLWRVPAVRDLYRWRWPIRAMFVLLATLAGALLSPLLFVALAAVAYPIGLLLGMVGLQAGAAVVQRYLAIVSTAFGPAGIADLAASADCCPGHRRHRRHLRRQFSRVAPRAAAAASPRPAGVGDARRAARGCAGGRAFQRRRLGSAEGWRQPQGAARTRT